MSSVYGLHDTHLSIKPFQRLLNETFNIDLKVDGNIGKVTQEAIGKYQNKYSLNEKDEYGYCYGPLTQAVADPIIRNRYLQEEEFVNGGKLLGIETLVIKAFAVVEAKEYGFMSDGFPVILFERHKFYSYIRDNLNISLANEYALKYPNICNKEPGGYVGGKGEFTKYSQASKLDLNGAKSSCSWGMFQIMGFNFKACGYENVDSFVSDMIKSEDNHLKAFVNFIKSDAILHKALMQKDWTGAARRYNGPAYARNQYDVKMTQAYTEFKNE